MPQAIYSRVQASLVKVGTKLIADCPSSCWPEGQLLTVEEKNGHLCVPCSQGEHFLDSQLILSTHGNFYLGFTLVQE